MPFPFELAPDQLPTRLDQLVDTVWATLQSNFLALPKGQGFIAYERFATACDVLYQETRRFQVWTPDNLWAAFERDRLVFVVVRTILGLSPPEWAYLAASTQGVSVEQNQARTLDRFCREPGIKRLSLPNGQKVRAMFAAATQMLTEPIPPSPDSVVHRLAKVDTQEGLVSLRHVAASGVPYAMLLYERFLGRPFASHRDAVSEAVGDVMEAAVEHELSSAGIVYRKTKRAERVPGFPQAPDFIVPDEWRPSVAIEAKITEDDGTARDKVTRILRLVSDARSRAVEGTATYQVVACIDGRGFGVRREDMRNLILATEGKVFTLATLSRMVDHTDLASQRTA